MMNHILTYQAKIVIGFYTQWEVYFQIKFHPAKKFYLFHETPGMKLACKQKLFHLGASFIPGWDFVSVFILFHLFNLSLKLTESQDISYNTPT